MSSVIIIRTETPKCGEILTWFNTFFFISTGPVQTVQRFSVSLELFKLFTPTHRSWRTFLVAGSRNKSLCSVGWHKLSSWISRKEDEQLCQNIRPWPHAATGAKISGLTASSTVSLHPGAARDKGQSLASESKGESVQMKLPHHVLQPPDGSDLLFCQWLHRRKTPGYWFLWFTVWGVFTADFLQWWVCDSWWV